MTVGGLALWLSEALARWVEECLDPGRACAKATRGVGMGELERTGGQVTKGLVPRTTEL